MNAIESKSQISKIAPQTKGRTIRWVNHYDGFVRLMTLGKDKAVREMTADLARVKPGDTVLDVGCGTGDLTMAAKRRAGSNGSAYGIDASPEMIETARAKASARGIGVDFRVEVIEALPFADNTFDVVLSSLMMHHLPDDVKLRGMSEVYRILKPGGRLLVIDLMRPMSVHDRILMKLFHHEHLETGAQDLPAMMCTVGFTRIETGGISLLPMLGFACGERETDA
jgi:demethylmenaquinone methyltransferase/2-methoxy-6-polyprenyl-1,4-benzoquinol methylase/phosphoethanolamine N-methyltransferase